MMLKRRAKIESDFKHRDRLRRLLILIIPRKFGVAFLRRRLKDNYERCSLEATKFLLDTNTLYSSKFHFLLPKFLRFVFALGAPDIQTDFVNQFVQALKTTRSNPQKRKAMCEEMLIHSRFLQSNSASSSSWKLTSLALSGFGFIRAGQIARRYCLDSAIREANSGRASTRTLHLAISGLLENRRFEEAQDLTLKYSNCLEFDPRISSYTNYLKLVCPNTLVSYDRKSTSVPLTPSVYSNITRDKKIALVAPGVVDSSYGDDIDRHEVVARIKYFGAEYSLDPTKVGTRCDINFLLDQFAESIIIDRNQNPGSHSFINKTRLVVTRKKSFNTENFPLTHPLSSLAPTFLTTATSGTMAIFDLLCQNPKSIKLFGFNFYSLRGQYNQSIMKLYESKKFIRKNGLRKSGFDYSMSQRGSSVCASARTNHDYLSDFLLVKNLYELSGLIDGTPEVLEILNLTADEYDARLEEMLGDW